MDLLEIALLPMSALGILETLFLNQPLILLILLRWCNTPHNFMVHNIHRLNHSLLCHSHNTVHLNAPSHKLDVSNCFLFSSNPFWSPPSLTHSIFSTHIVDRHAHNTSEWIIDTSATNHMVHSVSLLTTITSTINTFVSLPNGEQTLVTHIGTVQLSETLNLHGVLYVPSFTFNLISVT